REWGAARETSLVGSGTNPTAPYGASVDDADVLRLGALGPRGHLELNLVVLLQVPVAGTGDGAEVDEDIGTGFLRDEPETLVAVEPLDGAGCHWTFPPFLARFEPTRFARPGGLVPPRELPATVLRTHTLSYEASRRRPPGITSPRRSGRSEPTRGCKLQVEPSDLRPGRRRWRRGTDEPQGCGEDGRPHRLERLVG